MNQLHQNAKALASAQAQVAGLQMVQSKLLLSRHRLFEEFAHDKRAEKNESFLVGSAQQALTHMQVDETVLRRHLLDIHEYNLKCHERATTIHQRATALSKIKPKVTAAGAAGERQAEQTQMANLQRLRAEVAMLQAEIQRVEGSSTEAFAALKGHITRTNLLEQEIIRGVRNMSGLMFHHKEHTNMLQESIQANIAATTELEGRKKTQVDELDEWREKVNPVVFAALEVENTQLELELQ